jgi:uncharacterized membrane protein YtjA (UPF0391 family)
MTATMKWGIGLLLLGFLLVPACAIVLALLGFGVLAELFEWIAFILFAVGIVMLIVGALRRSHSQPPASATKNAAG